MKRKSKVSIGIAVLLAAAGGGVAIGAASTSSPSEENQAVLDDAAKQLGVSSTKLSSALKQALSDRVDAAVAAGRLTKAQGDAVKQRINSDAFPLFGGLGRDHGHFGFGGIDAAATYLGLTEAQLHSELEGGKTLAQVAQAHGKSVDGLIAALVDATKKRLDDAVASGRLTQAQETEMLSGLRDRVSKLVNSSGPPGDHFGRPSFGFRHFGRPPA
jgi:uncharacterized protein YidB (DUF937 family)